MAFEKLTGLVNLEELEKESDLFNVNGGKTGKFCAPATGEKTYSGGTVFCSGTKHCVCCDPIIIKVTADCVAVD